MTIEGVKMRQKSGQKKELAEKVIRAISRDPRKQYSAEEKIRIVLAGLRGEDNIAELCRRVLRHDMTASDALNTANLVRSFL